MPVKPLQVFDEKANCYFSADVMHPILFDGNQVTRKRAESATEGRKMGLLVFLN